MQNKANQILVSFVVPVYNVEAYVERCLNSLFSQGIDEERMEIVVVDDGSTDGSLAVVERIASEHPSVIVLKQKNQGLSAARNNGQVIARGSYIYFVDSDDWLLNNGKLVELIGLCEENDLDLITFREVKSTVLNSDGSESNSVDEERLVKVVDGFEHLTRYGKGRVSICLFKHQFIKDNQLRFQPGRFLEDSMFMLDACMKATRCAHVDWDVYCYFIRQSSIMHEVNLAHQTKLIDDYLYASAYTNNALQSNLDKLSADCLKAVKTRRDQFVLFGMIRAFKIDAVKKYIERASSMGFYPIEPLEGYSWTINMIAKVFNCTFLVVLLSKIYRIGVRLRLYQPKFGI